MTMTTMTTTMTTMTLANDIHDERRWSFRNGCS